MTNLSPQPPSFLSKKFQRFLIVCNAKLSRRLVFLIFLSIIAIEIIILIPSLRNKEKELLNQVELISDTKIQLVTVNFTSFSAMDILDLLMAKTNNQYGVKGAGIYEIKSQNRVNGFGEINISQSFLNEIIDEKIQYRKKYNDSYELGYIINFNNQEYLLIINYDISSHGRELWLYFLRITILIIIISIFVTLATFMALGPNIINPILRLREDLIKAGKYLSNASPECPEFSSLNYPYHNELQDVIITFIQMYEQVKQGILAQKNSELQLQELNKQLETRVKERTEELEQINQHLAYQAYHDELTDLGNRALLFERLNKLIKNDNKNRFFALLFLDLDNFKIVNDSLGHSTGDILLQKVAERFRKFSNYLTVRLGGDEFAICLDKISNLSEAVDIAKNIIAGFKQPFIINNQTVFSNISIGITTNENNYDNVGQMIRDSDVAMYQAKTKGQGNYAIFTTEMHQAITKTMELDRELRRVINNLDSQENQTEFELFYQPIIDIKSNKIISFEALIRWHHPEWGFVSPAHFIPRTEETGLILPLGSWIFRQACNQMKQWLNDFADFAPKNISINVSSFQFNDVNLYQNLLTTINLAQLEGKNVKIEITESSLINQMDIVKAILLKFKEHQITISLDDFGTGYSSLSYLHDLPFDTIKIDQSFVKNINDSQESEKIVQTIISLAHNLERNVIAEGVETEKDLDKLKIMGCDFAQGYFFSKPVNSISATALIQKFNLGK
ncbi:MAG: bifunctional diguanylate cyclase/phosphodiesterase [Cyanobacterium sp. T60_A2020_053]|nr:bifunctional diguanylate cyclase/phosphodiesterase [Cyanobacterium sp. T60_A2020_053]